MQIGQAAMTRRAGPPKLMHQEQAYAHNYSNPMQARASWFSRSLHWLLAGAWFFCRFLLVSWASLAIYYSNLPWTWLRVVLAIAFATFNVWALWLTHKPRMRVAFAGLFLIVLLWFISIRPSFDCPWRPEAVVMPRVIIDGDRVRLTGFRNFDYRSIDDFTVRWEEREVPCASDRNRLLYLLLERRTGRTHVCEFCF